MTLLFGGRCIRIRSFDFVLLSIPFNIEYCLHSSYVPCSIAFILLFFCFFWIYHVMCRCALAHSSIFQFHEIRSETVHAISFLQFRTKKRKRVKGNISFTFFLTKKTLSSLKPESITRQSIRMQWNRKPYKNGAHCSSPDQSVDWFCSDFREN